MMLRTKVAIILVGTIFGLLALAALLRAIDQQRTFMAERTRDGILLAQTLADMIGRSQEVLGSPHVQGLVEEYGRASGVSGVRVVTARSPSSPRPSGSRSGGPTAIRTSWRRSATASSPPR